MKNITLFPTHEAVFENPTERFKTLFFPLLTINLAEMNKGEGKVHFVSVYANDNIYALRDQTNFDYEFIKFDWTGDKYRFNEDFFTSHYFDLLAQWYQQTVLAYEQNKPSFLKKYDSYSDSYIYQYLENIHSLDEQLDSDLDDDFLHSLNNDNEDFDQRLYVESLLNYWITRDKYAETNIFIQGSGYYGFNDEVRKPYKSLSKTGLTHRKDELIGSLCAYNYIQSGEDEIKLNIDRVNQTVTQRFTFT